MQRLQHMTAQYPNLSSDNMEGVGTFQPQYTPPNQKNYDGIQPCPLGSSRASTNHVILPFEIHVKTAHMRGYNSAKNRPVLNEFIIEELKVWVHVGNRTDMGYRVLNNYCN